MGVTFYKCNACGYVKSGSFTICQCGALYCEDCRQDLRKYADGELYCAECDDYGEVHNPTDAELLEFLLGENKRSRSEVATAWKATKKARFAKCVTCGNETCTGAAYRKPPPSPEDEEEEDYENPWGFCCKCAKEKETDCCKKN